MAPPLLVGIAGGSGSGKSALAGAIARRLGAGRVSVLCQDAYYHDRSTLPEAARASLDYDAPDAFDQALLRRHLRALRAGAAVEPPRYCFATHARSGHDAPVAAREVVLVEGLLLFHDAEVCELLDLRLFLEAPAEVRLRRRIARDTAERGRTAESVVSQFRVSVEAAHRRYVEPSQALADVVLRTTSRLEPLCEIATTLIETRLAERRGHLVSTGGAP